MKRITIFLLLVLTTGFLIVAPASALAKVGVGVGLGKINIEEELLPGGIYKLPTIPVLNTGDEVTRYEMEVTYLSDQPELRPESNWFIFSPERFTLEGSKSQLTEVRLTLPLQTKPGDYFAYLEAHPVATGEGGVTIGIAAATKLNFTVKPANIWQATIQKISTFFTTTAPASYIILGALAFIVLILIIKKFFAFNFGVSLKSSKSKNQQETSNDKTKK